MIAIRVFLVLCLAIALVVPASEAGSFGQNKAAGKVALPKEAVSEKIMENGLIILAKRSLPSSLVSIDIKIRAGSGLEGEYLGTGISHAVEHMVFKGTPTRKVGEIEKEIKSYGGFINGSTTSDLTDYRVTVPSQHLSRAIGLMKDMLLNASFEASEFEKEKEVITKEIKLNMDDPQRRLLQELYMTSYIAHSYKYPTIGFEEKLKMLKREDLLRYYNKMYAPNRMCIAAVGDINESEALSIIEKEFKDFRTSNYEPDALDNEPSQISTRRREISSDIKLGYLAIGFHSTSLFHRDLYAMDVLSMVLTRGNNSRLKTALVKKKEIAYNVISWNHTPRDPGLFVIQSDAETKNLDLVENAITNEINKIKEGNVSSGELEAAKRMIISDYIFSRQTIEGQSADLAASEILTGDYDFSRRYVEGIQNVTAEDVKAAANAYLNVDNSTIVRITPLSFEQATGNVQPIFSQKDRAIKETLANGLRLIVRENKKTPTVSLTVAFLGGLGVEDAKSNGISNLAARMILKGTASRKEDRIRGAIEERGGSVDSFSGLDVFGFTISILKDDLDEALEIAKDISTASIFPEDQIDKEKSIVLGLIKSEDEDIFQVGANALRQAIYGKASYGLRYYGDEISVESLDREKLLKFYRTYCMPNNMVISVSGDVDSAVIIEKVKGLFGGIRSADMPSFSKRVPARLGDVKSKTIEMQKAQSLLMIGFLSANGRATDRYALEVLSSVLSGYSGRLHSNLRDELSIAYTLGMVNRLSLNTGFTLFYAATTKDRMADAKKALASEIETVRETAIEDNEIELAKNELSTNHDINMQSNEFFSSRSALDELYGLGYDDIYRYKEELSKVTNADVGRVAKKYLTPDSCAEVIITHR